MIEYQLEISEKVPPDPAQVVYILKRSPMQKLCTSRLSARAW